MTTQQPLWTIGELAEAAASVLNGGRRDDPGLAGQSSRRVRDVPDTRTIRWYQTTGLVDRPAALRGRTALYGRRHLAQLVAIKRLQSAGRPLAVIQAELAGSSDEQLEQLAGLADEQPEPAALSRPTDRAPAAAQVRPRFWTAEPAGGTAADAPPGQSGAPEQRPATSHPASSVQGVRLDDGVLVVLDTAVRPLDPADLDAVRRAARPVLDTLRERGLLGPAADSTKESA